MNGDLELGFQDNIQPRKIYIKFNENSLWHFWDIEAQKIIPIKQQSVKCLLSGAKINIRSSDSFGETHKLNIFIETNEQLIIESGLDTWFSKSFLSSILAILNLGDDKFYLLQRPIFIKVKASKDNNNIVFAALFDHQKEWIKPDYSWKDAGLDWEEVAKDIISKIPIQESFDPPEDSNDLMPPF